MKSEPEFEFYSVDEVADILHMNPQSVRSQAHADPKLLGFPVIVCGTRILIPKLAFIDAMTTYRR